MQQLLVYQSLWAMERRRPDGLEWTLDEKLEKIHAAGFDGAGVRFFDYRYAKTVTDFLRVQVYNGARERWGDNLSTAQSNQLEHELRVIEALGFSGFFLVMWDAVRFARSRNILCQGRGSAANSAGGR